MVGFNCGARDGLRKDTSRNIHAHGEYVVNIADESLLEALHLSAAEHPPDISEAELLGLEMAPSTADPTARSPARRSAWSAGSSQVLHFGSMDNRILRRRSAAFSRA